MTVHDILHRLTQINRRILMAKTYCTQAAVDQELNGIISDICNLGDELNNKSKRR
jgi:hypothetical protein